MFKSTFTCTPKFTVAKQGTAKFSTDRHHNNSPAPNGAMLNSNEQNFEVAGNVQYSVIPAEDITEAQWTICADTFTKHYGVWSSQIASSIGPWTPGKRTNISTTAVAHDLQAPESRYPRANSKFKVFQRARPTFSLRPWPATKYRSNRSHIVSLASGCMMVRGYGGSGSWS